MILSRKLTYADEARCALERVDVREGDERLRAAELYLKRDPKHSHVKKVTMTASGKQLYAFKTRQLPRRPSLVLFLLKEGPNEDITIVDLMRLV